jgi:PP-loop superfamily ATP-utilizing enzyme
MKNYLILALFVFTIFYINYKYTKQLDNLNKMYHSQTVAIENKTTKEIQKIKNRSLNSLQKLKNNIQAQSKNLKLTTYKLKRITKNINILSKQLVDNFINERKKDIMFLSRLTLRQKLINSFYLTNKLDKKFLYKEVVFFNLKGIEIYKKSDIEALKMDISKKENTFCKNEDYFDKINYLQEGQMFVSDVITCNDEKIIRVITPIVRNFKKVGFLSVALNYLHINKIKLKLNKMKGDT